MRAIIYSAVFTVIFLFDDVRAQAPKLVRSEEDVTALTNYLVASKAGKKVEFPLGLQNQEVFVYSFMSGSHKVMSQGDDSVLLINFQTNDDPEGSRGVIFQFTIEPELTYLEEAKVDKNWKELLTGHRVTQFHILELRKVKGKMLHKDLHLVKVPRE